MPHQSQLEKKKYRNWVQAGLGLKYVKEGLQVFCEDIVNQQHDDIINNIKQNKNLSTVTCGQCSVRDLMPDHVKVGNKQCPLGQVNCNCWYPARKIPCPNNVCGAIYDQIIKAHGCTPPAPYWKNTDIQKWSTDPWSIAKCFINAPGYDRKSSAAETDCTGLLCLIINNTEFHNHIQCQITGTDVFSKIKDYRNIIFHSCTMELDDADVKSYIADMKAVLQDVRELKHRHDSQSAVTDLEELEKEDFIITTKCEAEVFGAAVEAIKARQRELEEKINDSEEKAMVTVHNLPTKKDVAHLEQRVTSLESDVSEQKAQIQKLNEDQLKFKDELGKLKAVQSSHKEQNDYVQTKLDFQRELIDFYKKKLLIVSVLPLNQRKNVTEFTSVYVKPQMVTERKKPQAEQPGEIEISSIHEMFIKDGRPVKSIYVVGKAGSGKTTFCKNLVNIWCMAHSEQQINEDHIGEIEEMRKFEFLFHISLSHVSDKTSIREMLCKIYGRPVLEEILDNESRTCLIILDGLDEWNPVSYDTLPFQTEGLPMRDLFKNYTVITTSRPWKIETLQITDDELQLKVKLKDFDELAVNNMIERTVEILNESFSGNKIAEDCKKQIAEMPVSDVKHTPIMLQQLICLWFDGKLLGTSRCAIYGAMLELFFEWNAKINQNEPCFVTMRTLSTELRDVKLPEPLTNIDAFRTFKYLIENVSRLAFETLFNSKRETSVSFDTSLFERFDVSEDTKICCLKLGVLSEDKEESLTASQRQSSIYSFVHKSEQEFLAAVYVSIHSRAMLEKVDRPDSHISFLNQYFKGLTVDDILDKANVFIMLCGLVPHLAIYITKYIYSVVTDDKRAAKYRTSVNLKHFEEWNSLISNIQSCIYCCIDELLAREKHCESQFYLGDVIVRTEKEWLTLLRFCDKKLISPVTVMSFDLETLDIKEENKKDMYKLFKYLSGCRRLTAIKIYSHQKFMTNETEQCICDILDANISTLKSVSVEHSDTLKMSPVVGVVISRLRSMTCLVALRIQDLKMSHEQSISLVSFLAQTEHLEQISLTLYCDCSITHDVDLSKNKNLQCLEFCGKVCPILVNKSNLEDFLCDNMTDGKIGRQLIDSLSKAYKLKTLWLAFYVRSPLNYGSILVTKNLTTLLLSLHCLCKLELHEFTFTDNIISCPSEMKHLEKINLFYVTMGVTTWRKFVDSLTEIPGSVSVNVHRICITRDGEECDRDTGGQDKGCGEEAAAFQNRGRKQNELLTTSELEKVRTISFNRWKKGGGEEAAAFQYVREHGALFTVKLENVGKKRDISFSTKQ